MIPSDDPGHDWDVYCDEQERAYKARIEGKTCGDCDRCEKPDDGFWTNPERMGYCKEIGEFVSLDDSVEEEECEDFEC